MEGEGWRREEGRWKERFRTSLEEVRHGRWVELSTSCELYYSLYGVPVLLLHPVLF